MSACPELLLGFVHSLFSVPWASIKWLDQRVLIMFGCPELLLGFVQFVECTLGIHIVVRPKRAYYVWLSKSYYRALYTAC